MWTPSRGAVRRRTLTAKRGSCAATTVRDLRFEDFPVLVTVPDLDNDPYAEQHCPLTIAAGLEVLGCYQLMVVFDLQRAVWRSA